MTAGIDLVEVGAHVAPTASLADLTEALATALAFAPPSRWAIGDLALAVRRQYGEAALLDAAPVEAKRARLLAQAMAVCERFGHGWRLAYPGLEFGHFRRVLGPDDRAAHAALAEAQANGWTPAQLGRWLAGVDPDEPALGAMLDALAFGGSVLLRRCEDGWKVAPPTEGPAQPTYTAAIRAAYRLRMARVGAKVAA